MTDRGIALDGQLPAPAPPDDTGPPRWAGEELPPRQPDVMSSVPAEKRFARVAAVAGAVILLAQGVATVLPLLRQSPLPVVAHPLKTRTLASSTALPLVVEGTTEAGAFTVGATSGTNGDFVMQTREGSYVYATTSSARGPLVFGETTSATSQPFSLFSNNADPRVQAPAGRRGRQ